MRRVVAVLGAVLMVIVAILVRGVIAGDDDSGSGSSSSDGGSDGEVTLLCADELESVCQNLVDSGSIADFDTEPAGETVDRMAAPGEELGADAWLTLDPFPGIADIARDPGGGARVFGEPMHTGQTTGLAISTHPDRTDPLTEACGGEIDWPCLGEISGEPWAAHGSGSISGTINLGFDDPSQSAAGLLVMTQATGAHLDDPAFASNDLDVEVTRWLGGLDDEVDPGLDDALTEMITQGAGRFAVVAALGAEADALRDTDRGQDTGIFYPAPMYRAEVVLAAPGGSAEDLVDADDLNSALTDAGWEDTAIDVPLPDAGVLYALRELL